MSVGLELQASRAKLARAERHIKVLARIHRRDFVDDLTGTAGRDVDVGHAGVAGRAG